MLLIGIRGLTESAHVKLCELKEHLSEAILSQAAEKAEGATAIPKGSRKQALPKRRAPEMVMKWSDPHGDMGLLS